MRASLPTPLGPLMTMTRGPGAGQSGSELKAEPRDASRARRSSERSALSRAGIGTVLGRRASDISEKNRGVVEDNGRLGFAAARVGVRELGNLGASGFGLRRKGGLVREREVVRNLRNIESERGKGVGVHYMRLEKHNMESRLYGYNRWGVDRLVL